MSACIPCDQVASVRDLYRSTPTESLPEWIWQPEGQLQFDLAFAVWSDRYGHGTIQPHCVDDCLESWTNPEACRTLIRHWTAYNWN